MWEGETVVRRCGSSQGGVKVVSVKIKTGVSLDGKL